MAAELPHAAGRLSHAGLVSLSSVAVGALLLPHPAMAVTAAAAPLALVAASSFPPALTRYHSRRVRSGRLLPVQRQALVAMYAVLLSGLVFRIRTSDQIADNPLDFAGLFRVGCLVAAVFLAGAGLLRCLPRWKSLAVSTRAYCLYVLAIPLGALYAVQPGLVAFRLLDVGAAFLVWVAISVHFRGDPIPVVRHLAWFVGGLVATIMLGALLDPGRALRPTRGGVLPFRLAGVLPAISENGVGRLGLVVLAFALTSKRPKAWAVGVGVGLILLAQYRTGYIGAVVMLGLWLLANRSPLSKIALVVVVALSLVALRTPEFQNAWQRGESSASTLSGRTVWWKEAVASSQRSSLVGIGLSSGTRFELFGERSGQSTLSTVHNTWVEAYVGTGVVGVALLGVAFVSAVPLVWRAARRRGLCFPLSTVGLVAVTSITGTTIELGGILTVLFGAALLVASSVQQREGPGVAPVVATG